MGEREESRGSQGLISAACRNVAEKDLSRSASSLTKINRKRSHSSPLPQLQYTRTVIIHSRPPTVIQTEPHNFMGLVQSLTGSPRTRSRWKRTKRPTAGGDLCQQAGVADKNNEDCIGGGSNEPEDLQMAQLNTKTNSMTPRGNFADHKSPIFQEPTASTGVDYGHVPFHLKGLPPASDFGYGRIDWNESSISRSSWNNVDDFFWLLKPNCSCAGSNLCSSCSWSVWTQTQTAEKVGFSTDLRDGAPG